MKDIGIQLTDGTNETVDLKIEVVRDSQGLITNGLILGNTLRQNQALIIVANQGDYFSNPTIGASIDDLILDNDYLRMRHRIREHLIKDGMKVKQLDFSENKPLNIEAIYE